MKTFIALLKTLGVLLILGMIIVGLVCLAAKTRADHRAYEAAKYGDWIIRSGGITIEAVWLNDWNDHVYYRTADGASGTVTGTYSFERRPTVLEKKP